MARQGFGGLLTDTQWQQISSVHRARERELAEHQSTLLDAEYEAIRDRSSLLRSVRETDRVFRACERPDLSEHLNNLTTEPGTH